MRTIHAKVRPGSCQSIVNLPFLPHVRRALAWIVCLASLVVASELSGQGAPALPRPNGSPPHFQVRRWNAEDGLPQNTVAAILQAHDGYLWIGTRYGLARYDGLRFVTYQTELGAEDTAYDCRGLAEDSKGNLWIQTTAGLIVRDRGRFRMMLRSGGWPGQQIEHLAPRAGGGVWIVAAHGLYAMEADSSAAKSILPAPARFPFDAVSPGETGQLWIRSWDANIRELPFWWQFSPGSGAFSAATNVLGAVCDQALFVFTDRSDRTWVARRNELHWKEGSKWSSMPASNAWGDRQIKSMSDGGDGSVWLLSDGAKQAHQVTRGRLVSYSRGDGLPDATDVRSMLVDHEGNVWLGTGSEGLLQLQSRRVFSLLGAEPALLGDVYSIFAGSHDRIWLGRRAGLTLLQGGRSTTFLHAPPEFKGRTLLQRINAVWEARDGRVWAGMVSGGLLLLEDGLLNTVQGARRDKTSSWNINALFEDHDGRMWVGSTRGLLRQELEAARFAAVRAGGLDQAEIRGIIESADGTIWVGTEEHGIVGIQRDTIRTIGPADGLLNVKAWPLAADADGSVWVGTPAGLNRIRASRIDAVTVGNGLFDNLAYCLLEDGRGRYWSFCNRGIWRVRKDELNAVADGRATRLHCVRFGTSDGMVSIEGNGDQQPSAAKINNGEFWFPTTRGVVIVNPETLQDNVVPPPVTIEEVVANGEVMRREGDRNGTAPLRLAPGRARSLDIRYTAATFIDADRARFKYKLEGHDRDWREADTQRKASYTNLRPGAHRFLVKACNNHGYWNEEPATFAFVIEPHFHETWWFRVLSIVTAAGMVLGLHHRRVRALARVQYLRHEQAMNLERSRIARDLHDDLGGNLTGLALKLEALQNEIPASVPAGPKLHALERDARAFGEQLRQVVWIVDPGRDTLEDLAAYLCHYMPQFLDDTGIRCLLDVPRQFDKKFLSAEARHHLLLLVKEAMHNVVRHARATEVRLVLRIESSDLLMAIEDNGRGLPVTPPSAGRLGHGHASMKQRATALGGTLTIENRVEGGCRVAIRLPLPLDGLESDRPSSWKIHPQS